MTTFDEALAFLRERVAELEPPPACSCVASVFPKPDPARVTSGEKYWRPGLVMAPVWAEWFSDAISWDQAGQPGMPPVKPDHPYYVTCGACGGTGMAAPASGPWHDALTALEGGRVGGVGGPVFPIGPLVSGTVRSP